MNWTCSFPLDRYPVITLAHGAGGKLTQSLLDQIVYPAFANPALLAKGDGAVLDVGSSGASRLVFSTDGFVVTPRKFPGGDIGSLAVCGTCNDLAVSGAEPQWITLAWILEEGLPIAEWVDVIQSVRTYTQAIGVQVVGGDIKVVERGKGDQIYLTSSGVGSVYRQGLLGSSTLAAGDAILVSGDIGRHGVAILCAREKLAVQPPLQSDCGHLWPAMKALLDAGIRPKVARDLTRGGLATCLIELAEGFDGAFDILQEAIPVADEVDQVCELLGIDPLFSANEGRMVLVVQASDQVRALEILREEGLSLFAKKIGEVVAVTRPEERHAVWLRNSFGTRRRIWRISGEQMPRIC